MTDRYAPARDNLHAAGREIHRTWLLTWRIPVSAWHYWQSSRHQAIADRHKAAMLRNSKRALQLAEQYPSLYWGNR